MTVVKELQLRPRDTAGWAARRGIFVDVGLVSRSKIPVAVWERLPADVEGDTPATVCACLLYQPREGRTRHGDRRRAPRGLSYMNTVPAIGAPNSPIRRFQENPHLAVALYHAAAQALLILQRDGVRVDIGYSHTQDEYEQIAAAVHDAERVAYTLTAE